MTLTTRALVGILAGGLFAGPLLAGAQQPGKIPTVGYLKPRFNVSRGEKAFWQALRDLGYVEGQNVVFARRSAGGKLDRLPALAAELVREKVDIIVVTSVQGALAAKKATDEIPIVFAIAQDPVGIGLVESLAKPGGNVTGITDFVRELADKRLGLLKETVPELSRLAILLWKPAGPDYAAEIEQIEPAAQTLGLKLQLVEVRRRDDLENAFSAMTGAKANAFVGLTDTRFFRNRKRIIELGVKHRLPAIYQSRSFVEAGAPISYGPNRVDWRPRVAVYVDKILKGAKPASLPVEQPTNFELVINLETVRRLGITIPPSVLYRATEVIR